MGFSRRGSLQDGRLAFMLTQFVLGASIPEWNRLAVKRDIEIPRLLLRSGRVQPTSSVVRRFDQLRHVRPAIANQDDR
jgi:hypothetical protein